MSVFDETDRSIAAAVKAGVLDEELSAGPIAAIRELARRIDLDLERDNVSLPTYVKAMTALRLVPVVSAGKAPQEKPKEDAGGKLGSLRSIEARRRQRTGA